MTVSTTDLEHHAQDDEDTRGCGGGVANNGTASLSDVAGEFGLMHIGDSAVVAQMKADLEERVALLGCTPEQVLSRPDAAALVVHVLRGLYPGPPPPMFSFRTPCWSTRPSIVRMTHHTPPPADCDPFFQPCIGGYVLAAPRGPDRAGAEAVLVLSRDRMHLTTGGPNTVMATWNSLPAFLPLDFAVPAELEACTDVLISVGTRLLAIGISPRLPDMIEVPPPVRCAATPEEAATHVTRIRSLDNHDLDVGDHARDGQGAAFSVWLNPPAGVPGWRAMRTQRVVAYAKYARWIGVENQDDPLPALGPLVVCTGSAYGLSCDVDLARIVPLY